MKEQDRMKLLKLLERNAKLTNAQLAAMLGTSEGAVAAEVASLEREGIIKGYETMVDWTASRGASRWATNRAISLKVLPLMVSARS